jgi:hypothetical protein
VTELIGIALSALLLLLLLAGMWWTWNRPFVGLGLLVAGMAFHNLVVMALLRLGTPHVVVRAVQGWKEVLLLLLAAIAVAAVYREHSSARERSLARERGRAAPWGPIVPSDVIAMGFAAVCVIYFLIPSSVLGSDAGLAQRLVGLRTLILIPVLYFIGRIVMARNDSDRLTVVQLCIGAGAVVTLFGLFELFFIPTRTWLDWGLNQYTAFLGFKYHGPYGMPENFFITLPDGTLVRRMVSTYVSPLGIAYTGLVLIPLGLAAMDRRVSQRTAMLIACGIGLVMLGIALSITRLALVAAAIEVIVMAYFLRRVWIAALVPLLVLAGIAAFIPYASVTPMLNQSLGPAHSSGSWTTPGSDSSSQEHSGYLRNDILVDLQHPLGLGTGASTIRYGKLIGTGESAVLGMFGDLGVIGGFLYLALYLLTIWQGFRALSLSRAATLEDVLPLTAFVAGLALVPISFTSDLWGDLSVTLPFWWAAGASATLCAQRARRTKRAPEAVRRARWTRPVVG